MYNNSYLLAHEVHSKLGVGNQNNDYNDTWVLRNSSVTMDKTSDSYCYNSVVLFSVNI